MARPAVVAMVSGSSPGWVPVQVPASVRPYPVQTRSNGSSSCILRINSTGMSAAPVTATRKLDRSRVECEGWSRMVW